jgi:ATP-dependent protease ClpP protease subunit
MTRRGPAHPGRLAPHHRYRITNRALIDRPRTARTVASLQPNRQWYRIENHADADTAVIHLYDEIGYWGTSAQAFVDELKAITAPAIDLHINSPGGEVFDGIAIHTCLLAHAATVNVYIDGLAASAASFIAMAGDRITMARNATMMIHEASGICIGNAGDMRQLADLLEKLDGTIADIYAQRAGGSVEGWREAMAAETWYTAAEAVAAGLADEQTNPDSPADDDPAPDEPAPDEPAPADAEPADTWDLSVFRYAGRDQAPAPAPIDRTPPEPDPASGGYLDAAIVVGKDGPPPLVIPTPAAVVVGDGPTPFVWNDLITQLTTPTPPTVDDVLASLREAL